MSAGPMTVGQPEPWWPLYSEVVAAAPDLSGRLHHLVQLAHGGVPTAHVAEARRALWTLAYATEDTVVFARVGQ